MADALRDAVANAKAKRGRPAFVAFVTCGYPTRDDTVPILLALEAGGADVIELGVPFSDPIADGPTIQASSHVALVDNKCTFPVCLELLREARRRGLRVPVLFMGYYNPILQYGERRALDDARDAGAHGFLLVDLPPEENASFRAQCAETGMGLVPLVAPTTTDARLPSLLAIGSAFVYCVSVTGVTGARTELPAHLCEYIARVRAAAATLNSESSTPFTLPLAVGFGIRDAAGFDAVGAAGADGVVIGSAIVQAVGQAHEARKNDASAPTPAQAAEAFAKQVTGGR